MKEIPLTQGKIALIDDADFAQVNQFKWYAAYRSKVWYAQRSGKQKVIQLHTFLTGFDRVDHKDGDGLNCQRHNLRRATHQQNLRAKQTKAEGKTSKFRGVSWNKSHKKWCAYIGIHSGKKLYLGDFDDERSAAKAYDAAARKYFGEFAAPNSNQ